MANPVGRPPETEPDGTVVAKSLVNVTIPTKLANFLKENRVNRSQLFTRIVTMLYAGEICPHCYDSEIRKTPVGAQCQNCEKWISFNDCPNCSESYDLRESIGYLDNPDYNAFANNNDLDPGCQKCMPKALREMKTPPKSAQGDEKDPKKGMISLKCVECGEKFERSMGSAQNKLNKHTRCTDCNIKIVQEFENNEKK